MRLNVNSQDLMATGGGIPSNALHRMLGPEFSAFNLFNNNNEIIQHVFPKTTWGGGRYVFIEYNIQLVFYAICRE